MNEEVREWGLYILCALLVAAVMISAWLQVPELDPVRVMPAPSAAETDSAVNTQPTAAGDTEKININTATLEELTRLPELGAKTAEKIVAYRESHGGFESLEDLLQVDGIGTKKLEQWSPYLTV